MRPGAIQAREDGAERVPGPVENPLDRSLGPGHPVRDLAEGQSVHVLPLQDETFLISELPHRLRDEIPQLNGFQPARRVGRPRRARLIGWEPGRIGSRAPAAPPVIGDLAPSDRCEPRIEGPAAEMDPLQAADGGEEGLADDVLSASQSFPRSWERTYRQIGGRYRSYRASTAAADPCRASDLRSASAAEPSSLRSSAPGTSDRLNLLRPCPARKLHRYSRRPRGWHRKQDACRLAEPRRGTDPRGAVTPGGSPFWVQGRDRAWVARRGFEGTRIRRRPESLLAPGAGL